MYWGTALYYVCRKHPGTEFPNGFYGRPYNPRSRRTAFRHPARRPFFLGSVPGICLHRPIDLLAARGAVKKATHITGLYMLPRRSAIS